MEIKIVQKESSMVYAIPLSVEVIRVLSKPYILNDGPVKQLLSLTATYLCEKLCKILTKIKTNKRPWLDPKDKIQIVLISRLPHFDNILFKMNV